MSSPPSHPPAGRRLSPAALGVLCVAVLAGVGVVWGVVLREPAPVATPPASPPAPAPDASFPLTPLSSSPYLNTGPDAKYVGSDACRTCHPDRHESFRRTGMGRSMATVDPAREPPDATYDHAPSRRSYQLARKDGQVWHRELLLSAAPEVVLAEYPMKFVVGSGRHSLTYLCEADGFLVESPATWYTARRGWAMSPGYTDPNQLGFERATGEGCLNCHAGRAEAIDGSLHRMKVIEAAISCERCHGPGSLHAERHRDRPAPAKRERDFTIVNPRRLPRELAESICQQCHLRPTAVVVARGRTFADFRPGLPLSDVLQAYQLESENSGMTVVGHVEQLHLSKCYQRSDTLTCVTCHNPHAEPEPAEVVAHYRSACQNCHRAPATECKVSDARRQKESPNNDCVHCHMPRAPTEIPHLAFTHHRIAVHGRPAPAVRSSNGELAAFANLSRFAEIDRQRSLGLGYLEAANRERDPQRANRQRTFAFELLSGVRSAGLRDFAVDVSLARLRFDMRMGNVLPLADAALAHRELTGQDRCNALFLRADALAESGRHAEAVEVLRQLVAKRRHSVDWLLLADCEKALGREGAWVEALTTAARINPRLWRVHSALADHYQRSGDAQKSAWHRARAVP